MIVAPVFDGDNNETIMKIQHKLYYENLNFMVLSAKGIYKNALELLDINNSILMNKLNFESFDHRAFQIHHDIIAAYFRFQFKQELEQTLFENEKEYKNRIEVRWGDFWKSETDNLNKNVLWAKNIINVITIEEKEKRYQIERGLINILKNRYYNFNECKLWP